MNAEGTNMITIYDTIKDHLENHPSARERRFKDRALIELLQEKYQGGGMFFPTDKLADFAHDFVSYDRIWRLILSENPELRGDDYKDKESLEQEKILNLGYEVGYGLKLKDN